MKNQVEVIKLYNDPIEEIKRYMDLEEMTQEDFAKVIKSTSRASEVLNRKRKLSISMIRNIHKEMRIPLEILIEDYNLIK